jgi:hypothetical protein
MARPTKYSDERAAKVLEAVAIGTTYELAAKYAGISADTLTRWRQRNAAFAEQIEQAEGRAAVGWLAKIEREANNGDWRAASWKLERRYPQDYGKTVQENQHTGKDGQPISVIVDMA